jgi:DinB family protein
MEIRSTVEALARTPERVKQLVGDLDERQLRHKPSPERFSVTEIVLHLRDLDVEGYAVRVRRMLAEERPVLVDVDGQRLAQERKYNEQALAPALQEFAASRRASVAFLRTVVKRDLTRKAQLEPLGTVTLAQLLDRWREHDQEHLVELEQLAAQLRVRQKSKR